MTDIVDIPETEKLYKNEWLLFEVLEVSPDGQPRKGRLLLHHPDQETVYEKDHALGPMLTLITYAGPVIPDDCAAVL